jgi:hypothetical protein
VAQPKQNQQGKEQAMKGIRGERIIGYARRKARLLADIQAVRRMEQAKQNGGRPPDERPAPPGLVSVGTALERALACRSGRL